VQGSPRKYFAKSITTRWYRVKIKNVFLASSHHVANVHEICAKWKRAHKISLNFMLPRNYFREHFIFSILFLDLTGYFFLSLI
jgi:hypothetical protein